jgi:hypothetical protein
VSGNPLGYNTWVQFGNRGFSEPTAGETASGYRRRGCGFGTAPLEGDAAASSTALSRPSCDADDGPAQQRPALKLDGERLVIDHDFLDELSNELCSFLE